jgi:hypothetical protein
MFAALVVMTPMHAFADDDVAAASAAFAEAQKAQLRGDYAQAAELFEVADQAAPSPAALRSAIRNREASGQAVRAATLALRAVERYPNDKETRELAEGALGRLAPKLSRVRAGCDQPCQLTVDGGLVGTGASKTHDFFVTREPHTVEAQWPDRPSVQKKVDGSTEGAVSIAFQAPAAEAKPEAEAPAPMSAPPPEPVQPVAVQAEPAGSGLPPAVFWIGTGLTVVAGGLFTWSGLDTLGAMKTYETNPSLEGYDDGVGLERRTNILAGTTAVLGAATLAIGLFATDWGGGEASASVSEGGVSFAYRGTLP